MVKCWNGSVSGLRCLSESLLRRLLTTASHHSHRCRDPGCVSFPNFLPACWCLQGLCITDTWLLGPSTSSSIFTLVSTERGCSSSQHRHHHVSISERQKMCGATETVGNKPENSVPLPRNQRLYHIRFVSLHCDQCCFSVLPTTPPTHNEGTVESYLAMALAVFSYFCLYQANPEGRRGLKHGFKNLGKRRTASCLCVCLTVCHKTYFSLTFFAQAG